MCSTQKRHAPAQKLRATLKTTVGAMEAMLWAAKRKSQGCKLHKRFDYSRNDPENAWVRTPHVFKRSCGRVCFGSRQCKTIATVYHRVTLWSSHPRDFLTQLVPVCWWSSHPSITNWPHFLLERHTLLQYNISARTASISGTTSLLDTAASTSLIIFTHFGGVDGLSTTFA
jgi:hypothetical protein